MKNERVFKKLFEMSVQNPGMGGAKLAACVVKKNEILSYGMNQEKTDPLQARFGRNKDAIYLHAEIDALKKAMRNNGPDELEGATVYVARTKLPHANAKNHVFGNSKPCAGCMNALKAFKIAKVVYTHDEQGTVGELTFEY